MYKNYFLTTSLWHLCYASAFCAWDAISECVLWVIFFGGLLRRLSGVVVWEYNTIFNTKYFIINSEGTALCRSNCSAVLAFIYIHTYIHTQVAINGRVIMADTHSPAHLWSYVSANTHTSGAQLLQHFQECFQYTHTQVAVYWRLGWRWHTHTHTYTHVHSWLLAQTHISSRLQEHFSRTHVALHAIAYLSHQCVTSLLSRDGRIADCTVRHPGVKLPFSIFLY